MDLAPGTVVGNYVVEAAIGRGGVASVYRVRHGSLGTLHALKVLTVASDALRSRLLREGQVQARLRHPNLVPATDVIQVGGSLGLVLELVDGPPLSALIGDRTLSVEQIDGLGAGVLAGVAEAHRQGLVHRDLKPANVLVAIQGDRLVPRVTDFGLARLLGPEDDRQTRTGASLGTPRYMAREQIRDPRVADTRSDVWALGVLLYELAAGHPPFDEPDQLELFKAIDEARFVPLDRHRPDLPSRILGAIASALHPDPDRRPQDAGALLSAWGGPRDAVAADVELRQIVESLSPVSTTSEHPTQEVIPGASATFAAGATWAHAPGSVVRGPIGGSVDLEPTALALDDTPEPVRSRADPGPQPPAIVSSRGAPPWALIAAVFSVMVVTFGVVVVLLARPQPAVVATQPAPVPSVVAAPPVPPVPAVQLIDAPTPGLLDLVGKSMELLLDARGQDAMSKAEYAVAGMSDPLPEQVIGLAGVLCGRRLASLEELEKGTRAPVRADAPAAMLDGLVAPERLDAWLEEHPDDLVARAFRVLTSPTEQPTVLAAHLAAIDQAAPGRALPLLLEARVAWRSGRFAEADAALNALASIDPENPELVLERARVALARGRHQQAADLLDPLVELQRPPVDAQSLRARADIVLDRGEAMARDLERVPRSADAAMRFHLARADGWLERGDVAAAWEALDRADEVARTYERDERVAMMRVQLLSESLRLAVVARDGARLDSIAGQLRGAVGMRFPQWFEAEAGRRQLVAEAMIAAHRGREDQARTRLDALAAEGAPERTLRSLRQLLDRRGGPGLRVDPELLP